MAQLLHVMVVKKLVRSLSECKQTTRHTRVAHVPWSPIMTIRKPSAIPTPTQGYQKNPNEMLYRMSSVTGTETR